MSELQKVIPWHIQTKTPRKGNEQLTHHASSDTNIFFWHYTSRRLVDPKKTPSTLQPSNAKQAASGVSVAQDSADILSRRL